MTEWDISPFEANGVRVSQLRPPVVPEPPRHGEDPADCSSCRRRDEGIWLNDRWRLSRVTGVGVPLALMLHPRDHHDLEDLDDDLSAELGVLSTHLARHVKALPHISRCHVYRIGDGGAHLHVWFFARPEGQAQLFGSWLVVWDDLLPPAPARSQMSSRTYRRCPSNAGGAVKLIAAVAGESTRMWSMYGSSLSCASTQPSSSSCSMGRMPVPAMSSPEAPRPTFTRAWWPGA